MIRQALRCTIVFEGLNDMGWRLPDLRSAHKHLDYVIVEVVEELALKCPREALILQFARSDKKSVRLGDAVDLEPYRNLYSIFCLLSRPIEERMFVAGEFAFDFLQSGHQSTRVD